MATTYTQKYSDFIGMDISSDPSSVSRNRLAYSVNMWRDYESSQGGAIETFPGFRQVAKMDTAIHGMYYFKSRNGNELVAVHTGKRLYIGKCDELFGGKYLSNPWAIATDANGAQDVLADNESSGFVFNNNLHILDGNDYFIVEDLDSAEPLIKKMRNNGYVPTLTINDYDYEQRNMLTDFAYVEVTKESFENHTDTIDPVYYGNPNYHNRENVIEGFKRGWYASEIVKVTGRNEAKTETERLAKSISRHMLTKNFSENLYGTSELLLRKVCLSGSGEFVFQYGCLTACEKLNEIEIYCTDGPYDDLSEVTIEETALADNAERGKQITIRIFVDKGRYCHINNYNEFIPNSKIFVKEMDMDQLSSSQFAYGNRISFTSPAKAIHELIRNGNKDYEGADFAYSTHVVDGYEVVDKLYVADRSGSAVKFAAKVELWPTYFNTVSGMVNFQDTNPDYKGTSYEAICKCTKSAIYDGRIFLTGNPHLPNTTFYSHRNLSGVNDPTYFGVYNYVNDGDGNMPNVDMLSTPNMLMIFKNDSQQDGTIYYHYGADNTDEASQNLLPRIYPSTEGSSGLGSVASNNRSQLCCNFLDDPVFLSKRGLEGISKEAVNLERTIGHRSSNVDRFLLKEDLSRASLAEWKGYLVICVDGHMYLADSRYRVAHADGSYQYEWYYLEGIGTYDSYKPKWFCLVDYYPIIEGRSLADFLTLEGNRVGDSFFTSKLDELDLDAVLMTCPVKHPDDETILAQLYYVVIDGVAYIVDVSDEKVGEGAFHGAQRLMVIGERLLFSTNNGDVCVINTDMRGVKVNGDIEHDRIDRSFYSFNGVAYESGCAIRLDDCGNAAVSKATVCGTTMGRFKMMPGSMCTVNVSFNGSDWDFLGKAHNSRFDFADVQFSNFSFGDNEDNIVIFPEISRGWSRKQYYIYSDQYESPFGLYELSYEYYVLGRLRR